MSARSDEEVVGRREGRMIKNEEERDDLIHEEISSMKKYQA